MASVATQRVEALAELKILAQTASAPALDNATEVEPTLDDFQLAEEWEAARVVSHGEMFVPTALNGRVYRCIEPGTTGAAEPTWPVDGLYGRNACWWLTVTDGGVTWEDAGPLKEVFDVRGAAVRCVMMKLGKVGASSLAASANSWSADGVEVRRGGDSGHNLRAPLELLLRSLKPAGAA